ncbi:MAG: hypothetical protein AAGC55_16265, partial [Myxococcota bacterium]
SSPIYYKEWSEPRWIYIYRSNNICYFVRVDVVLRNQTERAAPLRARLDQLGYCNPAYWLICPAAPTGDDDKSSAR